MVIRWGGPHTVRRRDHVGEVLAAGGRCVRVLRAHNSDAVVARSVPVVGVIAVRVRDAGSPGSQRGSSGGAERSGCGGAACGTGAAVLSGGEYGARVEFEAAHGLSGDAEPFHNLSWTAEKQGQIAAAIDYEELSFGQRCRAIDGGAIRHLGAIVRLRSGMSVRRGAGGSGAIP